MGCLPKCRSEGIGGTGEGEESFAGDVERHQRIKVRSSRWQPPSRRLIDSRRRRIVRRGRRTPPENKGAEHKVAAAVLGG